MTFVCGILAIILPLTFAFGLAIIIGSLVLVAGISRLVFAFQTRRRWFFLAGNRRRALRDGGNLSAGEPTFERSFADPFPCDFSPFGGHLGIRSLLSPEAIPPLALGAD